MIARGLSLVALVLPTAAHADALRQQVLAAAKAMSSADFAFTVTSRQERTGTAPSESVRRYDPRRGADAWTLMKVDGRAPTEKERARLTKSARKGFVPGYLHLTDWFGAPATRIGTTPTSVTYRFAKLPKGSLMLGSHDASPVTTVDAVVNTAGRVPFVERARFSSTASFRMMMVVKVDRFSFVATNRLLPDGRPVSDAMAGEFTGSFMGNAQTMKTRTTYSDFAAAR